MILEDTNRQANCNKHRVGVAWGRMLIDIDASITWYFHHVV